MFPQIVTKRKKKQLQISQKVLREWQAVEKELQHKAKVAFKRIPGPILNQFLKVCRVKSIPQFYSNYFLCSMPKNNPTKIAILFQEQMGTMLTNRSHYHLIAQTISQRELILTQIRQSLVISQGFLALTQGKHLSLVAKSLIDDLVKDCETLQQLRELQRNKMEDLAKGILKLRANTVELIQKVNNWRNQFEGQGRTDSLKRIKIIYPHHGVNCILLPLYDNAFLRESGLKGQLSFGKEQDPFLQHISRGKKSSQLHTILMNCLKTDEKDYKNYVEAIQKELPSDQAQERLQKELQRERAKEEKAKEMKLKQEKQAKKKQQLRAKQLKEQQLKQQKLKALRQEKEGKPKIRRHGSLKMVSKREQRGLTKTSRGERSQKKIIDVDIILDNQKQRATPAQQPDEDGQQKLQIFAEKKSNDHKIYLVYKKNKGQGRKQENMASEIQVQQFNDKSAWQKQMKQEMIQKEKIKRLLKQTQRRANQESKQYQEKLKRYQNQVQALKSRIESGKRRKLPPSRDRSSITNNRNNKKAVASVYGKQSRPDISQAVDTANNSLLMSKLEEQSRAKKYLQQQIRELQKQKMKMQGMIQKDNLKASKEGQAYRKKIQKYEQAISRLKDNSNIKKKQYDQIERSRIQQERNRADNLRMYKHQIDELQRSRAQLQRSRADSIRMYASKQKEDALRRNVQQKMQDLSVARQNKRSRADQEQNNSQRSRPRSLHSNQNNLEIIKTKQTIQIVFQNKRRSKKKERDREAELKKSRELDQAQGRLKRLQKQRQLLQKKLQVSVNREDDRNKRVWVKMQQGQARVQRFQQQIRKERDKNSKLQETLRQMKKTINNQLELRLTKERSKFQKEKQQLMRTIDREKEQKNSKDRFLDQQMRFLKEMQKKQEQLIYLLQRQRIQKQAKERKLAEELQYRQQLVARLQIQEIKQAIQKQVRDQLRMDQQQQQQEEPAFLSKRLQVEKEIDALRFERDSELKELQDQNQQLRELITRIKGQEQHLLEAIRENIEAQTESEAQMTDKETSSKVIESKKRMNQSNGMDMYPATFSQLEAQNKSLTMELDGKVKRQLQMEDKSKKEYSQMRNSVRFKDKEKIENLVEFYLKSPQQYPGQKSPKLQSSQKKAMINDLTQKNKQVQQFQNQLFTIQHSLPSFVPKQSDQLDSHLLYLRGAYNDYASDALRRQLFPPLQENNQDYEQQEMSYEKEEPPMDSVMDEVRAHARKHSPQKSDKKNFLAINRMRLMVLQETRKEKQRTIIEQESRKKIQKQIFEKNRKKREKKVLKEHQLQEQERQRKRQDIAKKIKRRQIRAKIQRELLESSGQSKNVSPLKEDLNKSQKSKKEKRSPSRSSLSQSSREKSKDKRSRYSSSQKESSDLSSEDQRLITKNKLKINDIKVIEEEQPAQKSIDRTPPATPPVPVPKKPSTAQLLQKQKQKQQKEALQLQKQKQKQQRQALQIQAYSLQSEIREYIDKQQHFEVYQHFVNESQMPTYTEEILTLSSKEMIQLNGNDTLQQDMKKCCTAGVLVAKNRRGIEVGIGVFHKEYQSSEYICDFLLAHDMKNFLNLVFNFSRFMFSQDPVVNKVEFLFNLAGIADMDSLKHFMQFENKCRRMGQVFVKVNAQKQRKYVLSRALFQDVQETVVQQRSQGLQLALQLKSFDGLMHQVNAGFPETCNIHHSSFNVIVAYYLSKHNEELLKFQEKVQKQLYYRQLLVTALLFAKAELNLKNVSERKVTLGQLTKQLVKLKNKLQFEQVNAMSKTQAKVIQQLPATIKRCTLQVDFKQTNYLIYSPDAAINNIQSSNSSENGYFLSIVPKYKLLVIQAQEFLSMSGQNPNLTPFFYIKHYVKNMTQVRKENYQRVYLPQIQEEHSILMNDLSSKMKHTFILEETLRLGWKGSLSNSIIYTPTHKDLVIQRPFLVAVMAAPIERAAQGSPLFVKLIQ